MNQKLTLFATAFSLLWCLGIGAAKAQTVFTVGSNLPPVLTADIGDPEVFPMYVGAPVTVGGNFMVNGGTPTYTYAWSPAANFNDPTLMSPDFTIQDGSLMEVTVAVTDARGCIARDTMRVNYSVPIADLQSLDISMEVIPNPSAGVFSVHLNGKPSSEPMDMVLLDALGRQVYADHFDRFSGALKKDLNLSELSEGIYFLGLYSEDKQVIRKLMIQ